MNTHIAAAVTGLVLAVGLAGSTSGSTTRAVPRSSHCADLPQGGEPVRLKPGDFTTRIDHPYWPMKPGTTFHYVEEGDGEVAKVRVTITNRTKMIAGIRTRVVHDVVSVDGEIVENTWDWFAQDSRGSLWYLGEFTQEYEDGEVVSTEGSWKHGRDGAMAGVILPGRLVAGCSYREEYLKGEAEDRATILSTRQDIKTPSGYHRQVLQTANTTPLQPNLLENKFYAKGKGPVLEFDISPHIAHAALVKITHR